MNQEIMQYSLRLDHIGDLIIEISNLIGKKDETVLKAIENYHYACDALSEVKTPSVITEEHRQLVNRLNLWIKTTELLNSAKTKEEFDKALVYQKQEEQRLITVTETITKKLSLALR
jgi:hypothetical protein